MTLETEFMGSLASFCLCLIYGYKGFYQWKLSTPSLNQTDKVWEPIRTITETFLIPPSEQSSQMSPTHLLQTNEGNTHSTSLQAGAAQWEPRVTRVQKNKHTRTCAGSQESGPHLVLNIATITEFATSAFLLFQLQEFLQVKTITSSFGQENEEGISAPQPLTKCKVDNMAAIVAGKMKDSYGFFSFNPA